MKIDKLVLVSKRELVVVYETGPAFRVCLEDAYATWLWLQAPTSLTLEEFETAIKAEMEDTCVNYMTSKAA